MAGLASAAGPPWGPSLQDALQPDPLDAPTPFTPAPLAPWRTMGVRASACGRHGNSHLGVPALQTGELGLREVTGLELGWRRQNLALGALPTTVRGPPVISGTQKCPGPDANRHLRVLPGQPCTGHPRLGDREILPQPQGAQDTHSPGPVGSQLPMRAEWELGGRSGADSHQGAFWKGQTPAGNFYIPV